jgi:Tfp pilus assembly protein PilF
MPNLVFSEVEVARIISIKGSVEVRVGGGNADWTNVEKGAVLNDQDELRTGKGSRVGIKFSAGKLLRLRESSYIKIQAPDAVNKDGKINLVSGVMHLFSRENGGSPVVDTRDVSAAIRGTEVVFKKESDLTEVVVLEGGVHLSNTHGATSLGKGEEGRVKYGVAPVKSIVVNPEKEVQWALYYPDFRDESLKYSEIDHLIQAGEIHSATSLLAKMDSSDDVLARQAIIAVVTNNPQEALRYVSNIKNFTSTQCLVRAYVHQSLRQLDQAKLWALKAVELDEDNGEAYARLAELELGYGNFKMAKEYAQKALSLKPDSSYVNSVYGFVELTGGNTEESKQAFDKAISLNSENSAPYLGLGLTKIREGDLQSGREQFEIAAQLDPGRSIYRSYLGKSFFEGENEKAADTEYERAIELDPNDPTPYLYRAFSYLAQNKVVNALYDIEDSIARNNNRAVYRSQLLLDQDSSVRSTSLAEVFQQLGFSRVAQLEAMKSINEDYTNFGAHRLLSQSYEGDFYRDTQFVENTVADIFAPLSLNVFQGLSGYSSDASFNEYAALFDRDQNRFGLNTSWLQNDDVANANFFNVGRLDNFGYYAGYNTIYGKGRKSNGAFERFHRFDLAGQYQISATDRVLSKVAFTRNDDRYSSTGSSIEDFEASISSHHALAVGWDLITRFEYFKRKYDGYDRDAERRLQTVGTIDEVATLFADNVVQVSEDSLIDSKTFSYGAQLIRDYGNFSWILGSDLLHINGDSSDNSFVVDDPAGFYEGDSALLGSNSEYDTFSHSSYLYTTWKALPSLAFNLGANYSQIQLPQYDVIAPYLDGKRDESLLSPKLGFTYSPLDHTTIRGAYFKGLGTPNIVSPGGIEPTLVGSFSQKFGDLPGASSETFGIGIDHKIPKKAYFGAEYLYRDVARELVDVISTVNFDFDRLREQVSFAGTGYPDNEREHIVRAYSYHILSNLWSFSSDYSYWDLQDVSLDTVNTLNRGSMALNYFDTSRWFGFVKATLRNQELKNRIGFSDGEDTFTLYDLGIGYRLAHRHGAIRAVLRNLAGEKFQYEDRGREAPVFSGFNAGIDISVNF